MKYKFHTPLYKVKEIAYIRDMFIVNDLFHTTEHVNMDDGSQRCYDQVTPNSSF